MNFLSGLGNFAGGTAQGLDQGSQIALRAQQIRQAQFTLDQAKKEVASQGAAFLGLLQNGGGASPPAQGQGPNLGGLPGPQMAPSPAAGPQPQPPGQPSVPAQPQAVPQQPPLQQAPQAVLQPSGAPNPSVASPAPSPTQPSGGGAAPANTSQIDPTDPQAGVKVVEMIARQIKAANPTVDPQTLLLATQRVIDMSKGMAPQLRAGAQVVVEQLRGAVQERGQDIRADTAAAGQDVTKRGQDIRADTAAKHDQTMLTATEMRAKSAMDRATTVQNMITQRVQSGQAMTAREKAVADRIKVVTAQLNDATKRLAQLKNPVTGQLPDDSDPRVKLINGQIEAANKSLDLLEKAAKAQGDAAGSGAGAPDNRPTATDAKGNKLVYDGKNWVPLNNSGAAK